jgi:hypothetical protein
MVVFTPEGKRFCVVQLAAIFFAIARRRAEHRRHRFSAVLPSQGRAGSHFESDIGDGSRSHGLGVAKLSSYEILKLRQAVDQAFAALQLDKTNVQKHALANALDLYEAATDDLSSAIAKTLLAGQHRCCRAATWRRPPTSDSGPTITT